MKKNKAKQAINQLMEALEDKTNFQNILLRMPIEILERVDKKVKEKPWINRTSWIMEAVHRKLLEEEKTV